LITTQLLVFNANSILSTLIARMNEHPERGFADRNA
jgi:hypothetical protein